MKRQLLSWVFAIFCAFTACAQPDPVFENLGILFNPQIDATIVTNRSLIQVDTVSYVVHPHMLWDTQDTTTFVNEVAGFMGGTLGFHFDYVTSAGRGPSDVFINRGIVSAGDYSLANVLTILTNTIGVGGYSDASYIYVSANNITNRGLISVGAAGLVSLTGRNMDLSFGGVRSGEPDASYSMNVTDPLKWRSTSTNGTDFANAPGIIDLNWQVRTGQRTDPRNLGGPGYQSYALTNMVTPSNALVQVVFISTNLTMGGGVGGGGIGGGGGGGVIGGGVGGLVADTNIQVAVRFASSPTATATWMRDPTNIAYIPIVEFTLADVDVASGLPVTNYLYLIDAAARAKVQANWILESNLVAIPSTSRPTPYEVTRVTPTEYLSARLANTVFTNSLLYNTNYGGPTITNNDASYSISIFYPTADIYSSSLATYYSSIGLAVNSVYGALGNIGLELPKNWPGRVEIDADRLDLTQTRIRSEVATIISTRDLIGSDGLKMDSPYVYLDLASPTGLLLLSNTVSSSSLRFSGGFTVNTYIWTNKYYFTNDTVTNDIDTSFQVTVVDNQLQAVQAVQVNSLAAHSTNVVLADTFSVSESFLIDAEGLLITPRPDGKGGTTGGNVTLTGAITNLTSAQFPRLVNFTNNGTLYFYDLGKFGTDRVTPYKNFINQYFLEGGTFAIRTANFENSGYLYSFGGPITIDTSVGKLDQGIISAYGDLTISASDLKAHGSMLTATTLVFSVSGRFSDGGSDANNTWSCVNGFQLLSKPKTGDLLGTTLSSTAPNFRQVPHIWAAENRGADRAGFSNNAAIGHLVLDGGNNSSFDFSGTGTNNALYVDYLDLRNSATNFLSTNLYVYTNSVQVDTNFMIYFASASVPVEQLDGKLNGHLRWVRNYAGPNSSTNFTLANGQTLTVNRSLALSKTIDSDGDGTANYYETMPFGGVRLSQITVTNTPPRTAVITWGAAAQTTYQVEYTTNLTASAWQYLLSYTNNVATNRVVSVQDTPPAGQTGRYYRVGYAP